MKMQAEKILNPGSLNTEDKEYIFEKHFKAIGHRKPNHNQLGGQGLSLKLGRSLNRLQTNFCVCGVTD